MHHIHQYKKRVPPAIMAAVAITGLSVTLFPFASAHAQSERSQSPAASIVESFFQWRGESSHTSSSVWDLLPPGIAKKIFDDFPMLGNENEETEPTISDINTVFDDSEIEITWKTDERTRGVVYISTHEDVDAEDEETLALSSWRLAKSHTVTIDDLEEDTTYYAFIEATDTNGNQTHSQTFSFSTNDEDDIDTEAPEISDLQTEVTQTEATITWDTDEDADSYVYLSTTTPVHVDDENIIIVSDSTRTQNHEVTISGLEEDTTYYGFLTSTDSEGNTATSSQFTFQTDQEDGVTQ